MNMTSGSIVSCFVVSILVVSKVLAGYFDTLLLTCIVARMKRSVIVCLAWTKTNYLKGGNRKE